MTRKDSKRIELNRAGERQPRRFRWWWLPIIGVALGALGFAVWFFQPRLQRAFEPAATLPPPPPTRAAADPASDTGSDTGTGAAPEDAPTGDGGIIYATEFEAEADLENWELFDDGILSAQVQEGMLVVGVNSVVDRGGWSGLNFTFEDFVLEVDATRLEGPDDNGIIVVFRLMDEENYNRFDISSDGFYVLSKVRDGVPTVVSDFIPSPAINTGDGTNRIRIRAVDDTFSFAVNGVSLELCVSYEEDVQPIPTEGECLGGEFVSEWVNDDLPRGKIGLGAQGFVGLDEDFNSTPAVAVIGFDNLVVREP